MSLARLYPAFASPEYNVFPGTHCQEVREVLYEVSRLFGTHPIQRSASAITPRCVFSSAAHCFCGLTVRRCGHSLCALNFSRFLARLCGWCGIAVLPCFSASAIIRRHSLWSPLTGTYAAYKIFPLDIPLAEWYNLLVS
nr:MAG TPA_asm: hypothetical protein [Caudoviricetes sp.]